jgi:IMP dehydrogenase
MIAHNNKIIGEGLTYDDVLLVPNYSNVLHAKWVLNLNFLELQRSYQSAAMDTVTESAMAIAMAQEGGIGVLHKTWRSNNKLLKFVK